MKRSYSGTNRPGGGANRPGGGANRPLAARQYGQHHLVDAGTLDAILVMADVKKDDVVLEVGAADGMLTRPLAERAACVHAYEIDKRFAPALEELAAEQPVVRVHIGDALKADFSTLDPAPNALVANLAYNIAIPLIMQSLEGLPTVQRWAVMLQKELAQRLFASPRTKAYSSVSVLLQLRCQLIAQRPVPRSVFSPRPRVDSAFVVFERRPEAPSGAAYLLVERQVRRAFGQRRKMFVNSLTSGGQVTREQVVEALIALGLPATARPEELAPSQFVDLARELRWE